MPYLLLVFHTVLKGAQQIDLQKLNGHLAAIEDCIQKMFEELEGRFARALTMLTNAQGDLRVHLNTMRTSLTSLRLGAGTAVPSLPAQAPAMLPQSGTD